jgi:hypothetical protein
MAAHDQTVFVEFEKAIDQFVAGRRDKVCVLVLEYPVIIGRDIIKIYDGEQLYGLLQFAPGHIAQVPGSSTTFTALDLTAVEFLPVKDTTQHQLEKYRNAWNLTAIDS